MQATFATLVNSLYFSSHGLLYHYTIPLFPNQLLSLLLSHDLLAIFIGIGKVPSPVYMLSLNILPKRPDVVLCYALP